MQEPIIILEDIYKSFGSNKVLNGISLSVNRSEVLTLIGPSGAGKTTLLRCINLLEQPESGFVTVNQCKVNCSSMKKKEVFSLRKHSTMVFQNYNLFRNKTVIENVMEGLVVVQKKSQAEAEEIAKVELEKVGMLSKRDSYPSQLSGGQQQRVGIARALALQTDVILLDEPTSALDPESISGILDIISDIAASGITMIIVTHEMQFARQLSNRIAFIDGGKVLEEGTPEEIFMFAREERVRQFFDNTTR